MHNLALISTCDTYAHIQFSESIQFYFSCISEFGSLTSSSLVEEVKKLQNIAYQLGLEEAKEMTRGKLLHVLDDSDTNKQNKESHVQRLWQQ